MKSLINRIPIPISGLMLALASAGNLLSSYGNIYKYILGAVSTAILLLLVIKIITQPKVVLENMDNPVVGGVASTFPMGIMILSTYIIPFIPSIALGIWIVGILIHIALIIFFTKKFIISFSIKKVFTSYFVVYVGIVAGSVTSPAYNAIGIGQALFWFGFVCYLILLPLVIYRTFVIKGIPEPVLPTTAIFAAPASLCLAGYMSAFQQKNMLIVWFLSILSLTMLLAVLLYLPKLLSLKFYPSFSAYTFPFVISAIAIKMTNGFLINANSGILAFSYIVRFEELLSINMVLYVLIRYISFLFGNQEIKLNTAIKA